MKLCLVLPGLVALTATEAAAQIDYRNLDDERPVAVEDAYPIERYAFELLGAYRFARLRGGVAGVLERVFPEQADLVEEDRGGRLGRAPSPRARGRRCAPGPRLRSGRRHRQRHRNRGNRGRVRSRLLVTGGTRELHSWRPHWTRNGAQRHDLDAGARTAVSSSPESISAAILAMSL